MTSESLHNKRTSIGHKPGGISGIRRNRPSYSCEGCRSRRVKCDLAHPECSSCVRNGMACLYPTQMLRAPSESAKATTTNKSSKRRPARGRCGSEASSQENHTGARTSFWSDSDGLMTVEKTPKRIPLTSKESDHLNSFAGNRRSTPARVNHWTSDAAAVDPSHILRGESHLLLNMFEHMAVRNTQGYITLAEVVGSLPDRGTCDYFYSAFVSCVHPLTPLFHYPTFDRRYRQFWEWLQHWDHASAPFGIIAEHPGFLPLLIAVIYHGAVIETLTRTNDTFGRHSNESNTKPSLLCALGIKALGLVNFPEQSDLYSLAAFVLLQMEELPSLDTSSCSLVAIAIRIAQSMALHREDVNMSYEAVVAEERRRIWAMLLHLDILTARRSGIAPLLLQNSDSSYITFSEVRDKYTGFTLDDCPNHISPAFVIVRAQYETSACVGAILAWEAEGLCATVADVDQLGVSVQRVEREVERKIYWLRSLNIHDILPFAPPELVTVPMELWSRFCTDPLKFVGWAEAMLRYLVEQVYCDLFGLSLADVSVWHELRESAVPHFQALVRHYIDLNTTHCFEPFRWLCARYQPIKAVAVLNTDLKRQPNSPQALETQNLMRELVALDEKSCNVTGHASTRRSITTTTHGSSASGEPRQHLSWLDRHDHAESCQITAALQVSHDHVVANDRLVLDQHQLLSLTWPPRNRHTAMEYTHHDHSSISGATSDQERNARPYASTFDVRSASWTHDPTILANPIASWQSEMEPVYAHDNTAFRNSY